MVCPPFFIGLCKNDLKNLVYLFTIRVPTHQPANHPAVVARNLIFWPESEVQQLQKRGQLNVSNTAIPLIG